MNEGMVWCLVEFDEIGNLKTWQIEEPSNQCQKAADLQKKYIDVEQVPERIRISYVTLSQAKKMRTWFSVVLYHSDSPEK